VLHYGIVGALVMRGVFVFAGVALLRRFEFVEIIFGAILLVAGVRMLWPGTAGPEAEGRWVVRAVGRIFPTPEPVRESVGGAGGGNVDSSEGGSFFVRHDGKLKATSLFAALVVVEIIDLIFAIDSVPAVLAVTRNAVLAYSSNVFAILGLRAMYFALAAVLPQFRFLHAGLAAILVFTGTKMVAGEHLRLSTGASLGVLAGIVVVMVATSLLWPKKV
jgi:tellurite resistance protein TerC